MSPDPPQNLFIQNLGLGFYYSCTLDFSRVALDPPAAPPKRGEIIQKCFTNNFLEKNIPKTAYKNLGFGGEMIELSYSKQLFCNKYY